MQAANGEQQQPLWSKLAEGQPALFATHVAPRLAPHVAAAMSSSSTHLRDLVRPAVDSLTLPLDVDQLPQDDLAVRFPSLTSLDCTVLSEAHDGSSKACAAIKHLLSTSPAAIARLQRLGLNIHCGPFSRAQHDDPFPWGLCSLRHLTPSVTTLLAAAPALAALSINAPDFGALFATPSDPANTPPTPLRNPVALFPADPSLTVISLLNAHLTPTHLSSLKLDVCEALPAATFDAPGPLTDALCTATALCNLHLLDPLALGCLPILRAVTSLPALTALILDLRPRPEYDIGDDGDDPELPPRAAREQDAVLLLRSLPRLQALSLQADCIWHDASHLSSLTALTHLHLSSIEALAAVDWDWLDALTRLHTLHVSTPMDSPRPVVQMPELSWPRLQATGCLRQVALQMPLADAVVQQLAALGSVTSLSLYAGPLQGQVQGVDLAPLAGLVGLQHLALRDAVVGERLLGLLPRLAALTALELEGSRWWAETRAEVALPALRVLTLRRGGLAGRTEGESVRVVVRAPLLEELEVDSVERLRVVSAPAAGRAEDSGSGLLYVLRGPPAVA